MSLLHMSLLHSSLLHFSFLFTHTQVMHELWRLQEQCCQLDNLNNCLGHVGGHIFDLRSAMCVCLLGLFKLFVSLCCCCCCYYCFSENWISCHLYLTDLKRILGNRRGILSSSLLIPSKPFFLSLSQTPPPLILHYINQTSFRQMAPPT